MTQSPGLPEPGGGTVDSPRLASDAFEIRKSCVLLFAGIAITLVLFLALPFMQELSTPIPPPPQPIEAFARQTPPPFVPPPIPEAKKPDERPVPELKKETPKPTIREIASTFGPRGDGIPIPGFTWSPEAVPPEIFEPGQLDRAPNAIHTVAPDVPRNVRQDGTVVLEFIVTPQGNVTGIKVISSSHPAFDRPAVTAISKWRFEPGVKNNAPVSTRMRLPIRFNLAN